MTKRKEILNPFINAFYEYILKKDVNLKNNFLTIICIGDELKNKNIDLDLSTGDMDSNLKKNDSFKRKIIKYGNVKILLVGKNNCDINFLIKTIKKTTKVYVNKNPNINNVSFFDEEYVWSLLFNNKNELVDFYLPEEKDNAYKIFNDIKDKIKIGRDFKDIGYNN
ncbi:3',5'-cyclic adenosine monophosphate phosphodiesterase CpdA [Chryseobacterium sp. StRB126]|uniref:hypothetical protein n=1 Tax=Chryseobacterium sp. StRB126 TaxID=878220 RepID=UPI0004E9821D|nr:hypothetical protein [Chryseobacterium sp. StRB126]BAP31529.1 3',5'-cyclic adenosine monophosphate phosphodiesterase CpdA [Chryseobacterium sp. StRB126]